jgi:hypothetical protein
MQIPSAPTDDPHKLLACVEIGGGSMQTVLFSNGDPPRLRDGAHHPTGSVLALAVPGLIADGIVVHASNLDWRNVDPVEVLGLEGSARRHCAGRTGSRPSCTSASGRASAAR